MTSVYIKTFGCAASLADSEAIAGILSKACYDILKSDSADIIIIVSCFVKGPTENAVLHCIDQYKHKKLIIAGCMPDARANTLRKVAPNASLVGTNRTAEILKAVEKHVELLGKGTPKINVPRIRTNKYCAVIPISSGCLGECAYCCVKAVKGALQSCPEDLILKEAKKAIAEGCKELWITSQDNGCYGKDIESDLVPLLTKILSLDSDFRVRLGMMNPNFALIQLKELIETYNHPKLYKFLHIPVQSGSDSVLKSMNRKYSAEDFKRIVQEFRKAIPNITISTDIIVGLPGETKKDFEASLSLLKETKPDVLNLSRYWERPNTAASAMKNKVQMAEIQSRSRKVAKLFEKIRKESYEKWVKKECSVLITSKGNKANQWKGRNDSYRPVLVESEASLLGKTVNVRILSAEKNCLFGVRY